MKKFLTLLLFFVLLCGCGKSDSSLPEPTVSVAVTRTYPTVQHEEFEVVEDDLPDISSLTISDVEEFGDEDLYEKYRQSHDFSFSEMEHHMESTPQSSAFSEIGYSVVWNAMAVTFRSSGTYVYYDVPHDVYVEFSLADSLGGYFNDYIKPYYDYEKVG